MCSDIHHALPAPDIGGMVPNPENHDPKFGSSEFSHLDFAHPDYPSPLDLEIAKLLADDSVHHPCAYCGLDSSASVVKCGTCDRWFCNGDTNGGSHIVTHLVLLKHKVVALPEELVLGAETLECYNCGTRNVFMLGYVAAKQESVVVLLCRMPCAQLRDINWATNEWQPLISERRLLPWIAAVPTLAQMAHTRAVTPVQIGKVEAQWRMNRNASIDDIDGDDTAALALMPVLLRYYNGVEYQNALAPLVDAEANCDKNLRESQALEHILVEWGVSQSGSTTASFVLSNYEHGNLMVAVGDEIVLHLRQEWTGQGRIVRMPSSHQEEFTLELGACPQPPPTSITTGFTVEFVWKGTTYTRMQKALRKFAADEKCVSGYLYHKILGHEVVEVEFSDKVPLPLAVGKLAQLNQSQINAVATALKKPLSLIQGPPGTGKTVTSATIIYRLLQVMKHRILVCAPSNVAVDHLAEKLAAVGIKVVRLMARLREDLDGPVETLVSSLTLQSKVLEKAPANVRKYILNPETYDQVSKKLANKMRRRVKQLEEEIIQEADVVCCTCAGVGDKRLDSYEFRTVLIDESTQATEPEVLIPIVKGAKRLILVGDHQQLGPVILDQNAKDAGLQQSLFERLICLGHVPIRLEVQYRMNPALSEFSSNMFYEGLLQNGVTSQQRNWPGLLFPWPVPDCPMMFWANYGKEEIGSSGSSYLNRVEAMNVEKIITRLFKDGVHPSQIGVITPYEGQRAYIAQYMQMTSSIVGKRADYEEVEVTSVDAFQGREKDFIILLCVRANDERAIGFLKDPRRLNVALTRAKYGMVVLGNPRSLSKNRLWNYLLIHYRERGCLVEGPLENLKLSMVPLGKTETFKQSGYGHLRSNISGGADDFDNQLMLSFVPGPEELPSVQTTDYPLNGGEPIFSDESWPSLTQNEANKLTNDDKFDRPHRQGASQANGVHSRKTQGTGELTKDAALEEDLRNIANTFASVLNI